MSEPTPAPSSDRTETASTRRRPAQADGAEVSGSRWDELELQLRVAERDLARDQSERLAAYLEEVRKVVLEAWPAEEKVRYLTEWFRARPPEKSPDQR